MNIPTHNPNAMTYDEICCACLDVYNRWERALTEKDPGAFRLLSVLRSLRSERSKRDGMKRYSA